MQISMSAFCYYSELWNSRHNICVCVLPKILNILSCIKNLSINKITVSDIQIDTLNILQISAGECNIPITVRVP